MHNSYMKMVRNIPTIPINIINEIVCLLRFRAYIAEPILMLFGLGIIPRRKTGKTTDRKSHIF